MYKRATLHTESQKYKLDVTYALHTHNNNGRFTKRLWPIWFVADIDAIRCRYCVVHAKLVAKLDFVTGLRLFGLNYIAALCAGVETTVRRILMANSCDSVGTGSSRHGSMGQRFWLGWVKSRVRVTDPVADPVL